MALFMRVCAVLVCSLSVLSAASEDTPSLESLVIIKGKDSSGSGFIANIRERTFIVTNIHVIAGNEELVFSTAAGSVLKVNPLVFLAQDRDIAIIPCSNQAFSADQTLSVLQDMGTVAIGDDVTVWGNSQGSSVVTKLEGKVQGIGADVVEVDAKFVPGNSGSPVVLNETGEVIGVASYLEDRSINPSKWEKDTGLDKIRRFSFRIDNIQAWDQATFENLNREANLVKQFEHSSVALRVMVKAMHEDYAIPTMKGHSMRMENAIKRFFRDYKPSYGKSEHNFRVLSSFKANMRNLNTTEKDQVEKKIKLSYFRNELVRYAKVRDQALESLEGFRYK